MASPLWSFIISSIFISVLHLPTASSQTFRPIEGIRLDGGRTPSEGDVMLKTPSYEGFLPLCDETFGMTEANAVCTHLGFRKALRFTRFNHFNSSSSTQWSPDDDWELMNILICPETDSSNSTDTTDFVSLEDCRVDFNSRSACTSFEIAGVVCEDRDSPSNCAFGEYVCEDSQGTCLSESQVCDGANDCFDGSDEDLHLCNNLGLFRLENRVPTSLPEQTVAGTVLMKYEGSWKAICDRDFGINKARVVCRGLGYGEGLAVRFMGGYFTNTRGPVLRLSRPCQGTETSFTECRGFSWDDDNCPRLADAGVLCHPGNLDVQLVGGNTPHNGRLEILSSILPAPATICDTSFDDLDAQVVCKMLGYQDLSRAVAHRGSAFGGGSGPVWNMILDCHGDEETIQDCRWKISNTTCTALNTAAVDCNTASSTDDLLRAALPRDCSEPVDAQTQFLTSLGKIRGGRIPSRFDVPWLAALYYRRSGTYRYNCAAAIISEFYLLSAAHCFETLSRFSLQISVGDFNSNFNDPSQQTFQVDKVWIHEHYEELGSFDNDLALVRIEAQNGRGIRFGDRVKPVCMPQVGEEYGNLTSCRVAGWGSASEARVPVTEPRVTETLSLPDIYCERTYGSREYFSAGSCFGGVLQNPCFGDSGAPVTCEGPDEREVLYGIVSSGVGCSPQAIVIHDINVRVTKFLRWIQEKIY